jgi:hypothetical protein
MEYIILPAIAPLSEQPIEVLTSYIEYAESKIEINEVPMLFIFWVSTELQINSPISKLFR